jgi:DNA-binding winged helix-turn-helix (wHTH) protein
VPTLRLTIEVPLTTAALDTLEALDALVDLHVIALGVPGTVPPAGGAWPALPRPRSSASDERLHIDPGARTIVGNGDPIALTRLEFDLLLYLATRPHRAHRRGTLFARVWGVTEPPRSRTVDVHIRRLRAKLGPYGELITTVRGVGYRFDGTHRVVVAPSAPAHHVRPLPAAGR